MLRTFRVLVACLITATAAPALAAPAELNGFPVRLPGKNTSSGLLVVDLDADGKAEIVVVSSAGIAIVNAAGELLPGFPIELTDEKMKSRLVIEVAPLACDLDGDGRREVIVTSTNKRVWAVTLAADLVPGYPVLLDGRPKGPVTCVGRELVLTTSSGSLVRIRDARVKRIASVGRGAESGVGVADIDGDGVLDYITGGGDSKLHVIDAKGRIKRGFPYKMTFRISGIPAIGDVDDDGRPDIIFGSQDYKIHAVTAKGKVIDGFPIETGYRIYGGVALADLNRDGVVDIVSGSGDSKLYGITLAGKPLRGFPVKLDGRCIADPAIGDIDKDGSPEVAVVTQGGSLYLVTASGKAVSGFPYRLGGKAEISPAIVDLDGDGMPELIAQSSSGLLHAFVFKARGKAERALVAWPMLGHGPDHSGRFGPNAGRFKNLAFKAKDLRTTDDLTAAYTFFDLDGDKETNTQIRWYINGRHDGDLDDQRRISAAKTRKHQRWKYTVQEGENFAAYGPKGVLAKVYRSPEVQIGNTPPTAPKISLAPAPGSAFTTSQLSVTITTPSVDPDGDRIEYRHLWLRDEKVVKGLRSSTTEVTPRQTRKNEKWRVMVVPFDGEVEGAGADASLQIRNTPPGAPKIALTPTAPRIGNRVSVKIAQAAPDADGDEVTYRYEYWAGDRSLGLPASDSTVPAFVMRKGDRLRVKVTAIDDQQAGGHVEAQLTVVNTPPPSPVLAIWPARPTTGDALAFAVTKQAPDADGDELRYRHQWRVDGKAVDLPAVVPKAQTRKGQAWTVTLTPLDGETDGKTVSARAVIQNTPPTAPVLALDDYSPFTHQAVRPLVLKAAVDADGDPVTLAYAWSKKGSKTALPGGSTSLPPEATKKGQRWILRVTPNDGVVAGKPVSLHLTVRNSPPSAPKLKLSNATPTTRDRATVQIATPAVDRDADRLTYRYLWYRNGILRKGWPNTKSILEPGEGRRGESWRVAVTAFDGEEEGPPAQVHLQISNHAPSQPSVKVMPAKPTTAVPLKCTVLKAGVDPDGDSVKYRYRWYVDNQPVDLSPAVDTLPAALTRKKQKWQCEATTFDGQLISRAGRSAAVTIVNTSPSAPKISVVPATATTASDLTCQLDTPSVDADVDPLTYAYTWRVDGRSYRPSKKSNGTPFRIPAAVTKRGQVWECKVTPRDGEAPGGEARAKGSIKNSLPAAPVVRIKPERPRAGEEIECEVTKPAVDIDRDRITYKYTWMRDGVPQSFAPTSASVPGRTVKKDDIWRCSVTPNDGNGDGQTASSRDVVVGAAK